MHNLRKELDRIVDYLTPYLSLVNSHTVDFIVNNSWQSVIPEHIRTEVDSNAVSNILNDFWKSESSDNFNSVLRTFIEEAKQFELPNSEFCLDREELNFTSCLKTKNAVRITEFMSNKKLHEVECMGEFVAEVASISNVSLTVDIGSGKGYLTSVLTLQHGLKTLGMDCSQVNINGAVKTTMKIEKKWKVFEKKTENISNLKVDEPKKNLVKEPCSSHEEYYNKYRWRSAIVGDLYKQRIERISRKTNISDILNEEYPNEDHQNILLIGLHTCGNLASSCLQLFINNRNKIKSFINVGCCYHLIEEKFAVNPDWLKKQFAPTEYGFPMSDYLSEKKIALGRDARMCGTQKPLNVFQEEEIAKATKPLFYRALLQELMMEKLSKDAFPQGIVGRLAHKCNTFSEYAIKALKKLNVDLQFSCEELAEFEMKNSSHWERLKIFFLLKTALSPVIEAVILLDRLLYLYEKGVTNAFIVRLFEPFISPRCYAVTALSNDDDSSVVPESSSYE